MLKRHISEFGLRPGIGMALGLLVFIIGSEFLFYKTVYAPFLYVGIAWILLGKASENRRNELLHVVFPTFQYRNIRVLENLILSFPFMLFLLYKGFFLFSLILLCISLLMAVFRYTSPFNYAIPTPFYKRPFEFIVGFRSSYLVVFCAHILTCIGIYVANYNLAVFSLLVVILTSMTFYGNNENQFYVWMYNCRPQDFLSSKLGIAWRHLLIICLPISLALIIYNPASWYIPISMFLIGGFYLSAILLAKYSAYPNKISLPQVILLGICFWFPPLLLGVIPYFYRRSIKSLNYFLS